MEDGFPLDGCSFVVVARCHLGVGIQMPVVGARFLVFSQMVVIRARRNDGVVIAHVGVVQQMALVVVH